MTGFYILRVLFLFLVLGPIKTFTKFGHSRFIEMYKKVFFSEILLILIEGYLDFVIALFLYGMYNPLVELQIAYRNGWHELCKFTIIALIIIITPGSLLYVII